VAVLQIDNDITERKLAEEVLKRSKMELERRVAERTAALTEANQALRHTLASLEDTRNRLQEADKLAAVGQLAGGVAHEINNPLAIINEKAGLLADMVEFSDNFTQGEKVLKIVESIISSVERAGAIIHRLLGFARPGEARMQTIDLGDLIQEVLGFLGKEAQYRNLALRVHIPEPAPTIESDRGQLQQVFLNIVNNAFSAVEDGGRIDISVDTPDADTVTATICDNGPGISEEDIAQIFEPFFTRKTYGTGLGLSITYGIVQKLGGSISVKSKLGQGASFRVALPRRARPPKESESQ